MSTAQLPSRFRLATPVAALGLALLLSACATGPAFNAPANDFKGSLSVVDAPEVLPGKPVTLAGRNFVPGQRVQLNYAGSTLGSAATADAQGEFRTTFTVPASAVPGDHPLVVSATEPTAALVHSLKVSPDIPLFGADKYQIASEKVGNGLYQVAYSAKNDVLFVTGAVGRPPVTESELLKVNPKTLAVIARVTPAAAPANNSGRAPGVYAVYGVGVDDVNDHVWVTNTRQNTVSVYRQSDLKLVKQFEPNAVPHARDVLVDSARNKVYASAFGHPAIKVFDARTLQPLPEIPVATSIKSRDAKAFSAMSLTLDEANGKVYAVSFSSNEVAVIDSATAKVDTVFALPGAKQAIGIDYDPKSKRVLVAAQGSDNLLIADPATGKVLHDVKVGAGALNVQADPERGLAYVSSRGAGTITVVDIASGKIVANLDGGSNPNHLTSDGKGTIYAVNKARGQNDETGHRVTRLIPR